MLMRLENILMAETLYKKKCFFSIAAIFIIFAYKTTKQESKKPLFKFL